MGRHKENPVRKYFTYDAGTNTSVCKVEGCSAEMAGNHAGNLERHIQRRHPAVWHEKSSAQPATGSKRSAEEGQMTLYSIIEKKPRHVQIQLTPDVLKEACLELVTVNGRPFSLMDDSGFRKILDPVEQALGNSFTINSSNTRDMVSGVANSEREKLMNDLSGKLMMLKVDTATCRDRSVLGINAQYTDGDRIVLRTLAMRELPERHTADYISSTVHDVLQEYRVELKQIFSVTTDDGANMLKAVLSNSQENGNSDQGDPTEANASTENDEDLTEGCEQHNHAERTIELEGVVPLGNVLRSVRCSAHAFQLAIDDAFKDNTTSKVIAKARRVAKKLRTQNVESFLKRMGYKRAIADCTTRWHSTHDMLERLCELKIFCEDMFPSIPELHLTNSEWNEISNLVDALKPAKITTKRIQSDQLTAGDFYGEWLKCILDTDRTDSPFAKRLVQCLKGRQSALLDNDAFVAAVFLDPRYRLFLTEHQTEMAKIHLCRAWEAIEALSNETNAAVRTPSLSSEEDDEIEQLLQEKERQTTLVHRPHVAITSLLDSYAREPRLKRSESVLKYWNGMALSKPDLHKLAMSVIALPVTQVSVERAFSSLKFILSPLRSSLNDKVLEDILFIRLNKLFGM